MNCPLPDPNCDQPVRDLMAQCRAAKCWYVDSARDSDDLPSNCVLFVCALVNLPKKGDQSHG